MKDNDNQECRRLLMPCAMFSIKEKKEEKQNKTDRHTKKIESEKGIVREFYFLKLSRDIKMKSDSL